MFSRSLCTYFMENCTAFDLLQICSLVLRQIFPFFTFIMVLFFAHECVCVYVLSLIEFPHTSFVSINVMNLYTIFNVFPPKNFFIFLYLFIYIYDFISCRRSMGSKLVVPSWNKCDLYLIANLW